MELINGDNYDEEKKQIANRVKGTVMALSILPALHSCNPNDAQTLYDIMVMSGLSDNNNNDSNSNVVDFDAMKQLLEKNYQCLQVTCTEIGGLVSSGGGGENYVTGGEPCIFDIEANYETKWEDVFITRNDIGNNRDGGDGGIKTRSGLHPHVIISLISIGALLKAVIATVIIGWAARWYCGRRLEAQEDQRRSEMSFEAISREVYDADVPYMDEPGSTVSRYSDIPSSTSRALSNIAAATGLIRASTGTDNNDNDATTPNVAKIRRV